MWIPLHIVQEMRIWVLLGGRKNGVLHSFFTQNMAFVSLNIPVQQSVSLNVEDWVDSPQPSHALQSIQIDSLSVLAALVD